MNWKGQHILSTKQFDKGALLEILAEASEMEKVLASGGSDILAKKVMATIFFEASTRTRFSFEMAMLRLGGKVVSNPDMMENSSIQKKETLFDTARCVSQMADVIVARHPEKGKVAELAGGSTVPVLNAGDGAGEHPTQGLLDIYTIWKHFGRIDGLTVGIVGDLKNSRVLHSDCDLLSHFDVKFRLVSPGELTLPEPFKSGLKDFSETENLMDVIGEVDVISCNRLQKERFDNPEDCERFRGSFTINKSVLSDAKADMIVMNPLPRMDELATDIDDDPRSKIFEQVRNGVVVRMALLKKVLL